MSFSDIVDKRYSVRGYHQDEIEENLIMQVLDAGRRAPSACNNQPCVFIVIKDKDSKEKLQSVYDREWFVSAPVIIAVCLDHSLSWKRKDGKDYGDIDAAIAMDHMTLAAADLGLGTCWVGAFDSVQASKTLFLPDHIEPVAFTPLGYPALPKVRKSRKELGDIVHREFFGRPYTA